MTPEIAQFKAVIAKINADIETALREVECAALDPLVAFEAEMAAILRQHEDGQDKARARWERLTSTPGRRTPDELAWMRLYVSTTPGAPLPRDTLVSV